REGDGAADGAGAAQDHVDVAGPLARPGRLDQPGPDAFALRTHAGPSLLLVARGRGAGALQAPDHQALDEEGDHGHDPADQRALDPADRPPPTSWRGGGAWPAAGS